MLFSDQYLFDLQVVGQIEVEGDFLREVLLHSHALIGMGFDDRSGRLGGG